MNQCLWIPCCIMDSKPGIFFTILGIELWKCVDQGVMITHVLSFRLMVERIKSLEIWNNTLSIELLVSSIWIFDWVILFPGLLTLPQPTFWCINDISSNPFFHYNEQRSFFNKNENLFPSSFIKFRIENKIFK